MITNGTDTAYDAFTVVVEYPDVQVFAGADTSICSGDCATLNGDANVIVSPASQPTYQNNDLVAVLLGDASVNINIQDLNMTQILAGSILEVCINNFTFSGTFLCTEIGGCDCNGIPISFGETCNLDVSGFDVTLITPTGCEILLVPSGVATGAIYTDVCFIPSGGADINSGGFPSAGNWDPNEPFDNLVGCNANGVWTLNFNAPGGLGLGIGILTGWSITFDDPEISYVPAFFWNPTTDMTNETTLTPTVCPSTTGTYVYTLTAEDTAGCVSQSDDVTVNVIECGPCTMTASITSSVNDSCYGDCDGEATVSPVGGTPSYSYLWDPAAGGQTTATATNLCAGTYNVTITDADPCTATAQVIITEPSAPLTSGGTSTNETAPGACDGTIDLTPTGGTGSYTFIWSNFETTEDLNSLCSGTYIVTITDANGCTTTNTFPISSGSCNLTASIDSSADVNCNGDCTGSATVTPVNGTTPYTYAWTPSGATTQTANNLCAGVHNVTVTDDAVCTATASVTITEPALLAITIDSTQNVNCYGGNDGAVYTTASGGTGLYTYSWTNTAQTTGDITNLSVNTYDVTVTDANFCTNTASVSITEPAELTSTGSTTDESSPGACDGTIDLIPAGGTPTYTYIWDNAETTEDLSGLCSGWYYVTITDANGCTATNSFYINDVPCALTASITASTNVLCNGDCNGTATVSPASGTAPFIYNWSNGATIENPDNLCAGTHNVTVTDADSCNATASVNITEPPQLTVSTGGSTSICSGESEMISAFASGGTGTIIYSWGPTTGLVNPNDPNPIASPTTTTTYTVTVTDDNSCTATGSVIITVFTSLNITLSTNDDTICAGAPATIDANIVGGNPPYLITLDGVTIVSPPFTVYPDVTTTYTVTVEVDCGEPEASITIIVLPAPPANMDANPLQGCEPLTVQFLENALNPDTLGQTYLWDFGDETISTDRNPEHTFENAGTYDITLTVTSKYGCTTIISNPDMITVYPQPDAGFSAEPQTVSILKPIIFFNNHSSYTDTCYWNFGDSLSSTNLSNNINPDHTYSSPGTYTVQLIVATGYGCRDTVESEILVKDEFTFYAPTAFSPDKDKLNDIFLPVGVGIDPDNFFMLIYDRWGEKVFVTHDKYQGWDGRIKGKEIGENGIYTWLVVYKDLQKVEHQKSGKVTLIR